jgi:hypothetical protein
VQDLGRRGHPPGPAAPHLRRHAARRRPRARQLQHPRGLNSKDLQLPKTPCSYAGKSARNTAKVPKITCSYASESAQNAANLPKRYRPVSLHPAPSHSAPTRRGEGGGGWGGGGGADEAAASGRRGRRRRTQLVGAPGRVKPQQATSCVMTTKLSTLPLSTTIFPMPPFIVHRRNVSSVTPCGASPKRWRNTVLCVAAVGVCSLRRGGERDRRREEQGPQRYQPRQLLAQSHQEHVRAVCAGGPPAGAAGCTSRMNRIQFTHSVCKRLVCFNP